MLRFGVVCSCFVFFVALLLLHYPLLRLPYYWDEAGYYIPAALNFFRSGQLVPSATLHTGHPPLVVIYLALAWRVFGFSPLVTRAAMLVVAGATLAAVYAIGRRLGNREIAGWSVLLLALSPSSLPKACWRTSTSRPVYSACWPSGRCWAAGPGDMRSPPRAPS